MLELVIYLIDCDAEVPSLAKLTLTPDEFSIYVNEEMFLVLDVPPLKSSILTSVVVDDGVVLKGTDSGALKGQEEPELLLTLINIPSTADT